MEVDESFNKGPLHRYTVQLRSIDKTTNEVSVAEDGVTVIEGTESMK